MIQKIYDKDGIVLDTKDKYCTENIEIQVDDTNLAPENIIKGKMILGVVGSAVRGGVTPPTGTKVITTNGTHEVTRYQYAEVNVAGGGGITPEGTIELKTNGDHDVTNYATAKVNVPIPEGYIKPSGTKEITENGTHTVTQYNEVNVNVPIPSGYLKPEGTIQIDHDGTFAIDRYKYAEVSFPGYIKPSGNFAITENGDYNIRDKETVSVNVAGGGGEDALWSDFMSGRVNDWSYLFKNYKGTSLNDHLAGYSMENVMNLDHTFYECMNLTSLRQINTSKVTNFGYAFYACRSLPTIDLTNLDNVSSSQCNYAWSSCYSLTSLIFRNPTKACVLNSTMLDKCHHLLGTYDRTYNPQSLQDGRVYLPYDMISTFKASTNWAAYGDIIRPIYKVSALGNGAVSDTLSGEDTIWAATANEGATFTGWYRGFIETQETINESVTPIEAESVVKYDAVDYGFELGEDGYYRNTNQSQHKTACISKFYFTKTNNNQKIYIDAIQSSENKYDYAVISKINTDLATAADFNSDGDKAFARMYEITEYSTMISLDEVEVGSTFDISIKYFKDASGDKGDDTVRIKLQLVETMNIDTPVLDDLYSTDATINIGKVDVMTMEPLSLVAVFE